MVCHVIALSISLRNDRSPDVLVIRPLPLISSFRSAILPSTLQYKVYLSGKECKDKFWQLERKSGVTVQTRRRDHGGIASGSGGVVFAVDALVAVNADLTPGMLAEEGCRVKSEMPRRTNLGIAPNPNLLAGQTSRSRRRAADASPCREPERAHWRAASCSALR